MRVRESCTHLRRGEKQATRSCERDWQYENTDCVSNNPSAHTQPHRWRCGYHFLFFHLFPLIAVSSRIAPDTATAFLQRGTPGPNQTELKCRKTCVFSQWVATVVFKPLTLGQCHRHRATKAHVEHTHFTQMENEKAAAPVPFKGDARHSSHLLAWLTAHDITGEACIPVCCC